MDIFTIGFLSISIIDILDILAVTIVFYQLYKIMSGTRATQLFAGLLVLLMAGSFAQLLGMSGMSWIIESIGAVWVIAFVILFQPELRRMLIRIGQLGVLRSLFQVGGDKVIAEVVQAVMELSRKRYGALIVFQRTTGIRGVVETGTAVHAEVSSDLLMTIFHPRTPLHDGAVIISGNTIVAAHCILPLATPLQSEDSLGTRHRAALGVTTEVDAIAVTVSEETGTISVSEHGRFIGRDYNAASLREALTSLLYPHMKPSSEPPSKAVSDEQPASTTASGSGSPV